MPRKKRKPDDINTNGWMDTYADTITLLLTFFILLYSFSTTDNEKLKLIAAALKGEIVGTPMKMEDMDDAIEIIEPGIGSEDSYNKLVAKITTILNKNGLSEIVKIRKEDAGVVLQLGNSILFDPSNAKLKDDSKDVLNVIASIIPQIDNDIMIQGHTDNIPVNSNGFNSNWDLSTARALSVLKYFVEERGFDPDRFSAAGYGEYKPLVENSDEENKAINRRVDILILQQREIEE